MSTPFESGQLLLTIYELRRDPALRDGRDWFLREFTPATFEELLAVVRGPNNARFRMVLGYWDMVASLVTHGAIDIVMFQDANPELVTTFAKVYPFLNEMRQTFGTPDFLHHIESVVMAVPGVVERMTMLRERMLNRRSQLYSTERSIDV